MQGRRTLLTAALLAASLGGSLRAEGTVEERLNALEQKANILERRWEVDQENAAVKAKEAVSSSAGKDGFSLKSADGAFQIKFQGDVQADARFFLDDDAEAFADTFLLRRVRPTIEVSAYDAFDVRIQPNFGGGASGVDDAFLEYRAFPAVKFRAGRFKVPVGLENLQSSSKLTFIERGLPTDLVPIYDAGAQLHGEVRGGSIYYALGVFNGALDGASADSDSSDRKDFAARLFFIPFKASPKNLLNDLGFGLGASAGKDVGTANASVTRLPSYRTEGQNIFFTYRSDVIANGTRERVSPQLYWYPGTFGLLAEYVASSQEVRSTATQAAADLTNRAWQVQASYVLTGERTSFKGVKPRKNFDPKKGTWGALEAAGRYSQLTVDRNAFTRFADPARSARVARAWTGGVNWYLNPFVKTAVNYTYTWFDRGAAAAGNRPAERALFSRFQFSF